MATRARAGGAQAQARRVPPDAFAFSSAHEPEPHDDDDADVDDEDEVVMEELAAGAAEVEEAWAGAGRRVRGGETQAEREARLARYVAARLRDMAEEVAAARRARRGTRQPPAQPQPRREEEPATATAPLTANVAAATTLSQEHLAQLQRVRDEIERTRAAWSRVVEEHTAQAQPAAAPVVARPVVAQSQSRPQPRTQPTSTTTTTSRRPSRAATQGHAHGHPACDAPKQYMCPTISSLNRRVDPADLVARARVRALTPAHEQVFPLPSLEIAAKLGLEDALAPFG